MVFGDAVSKLETFVRILNHISRSITWSLFTLKASYLAKWSILTWSFIWWCQFIDWLKFETRPVPCWISERPIAHKYVTNFGESCILTLIHDIFVECVYEKAVFGILLVNYSHCVDTFRRGLFFVCYLRFLHSLKNWVFLTTDPKAVFMSSFLAKH